MYYIEHKYGNDGFATWIKILRALAVTDYHYLNLSDNVELMFLASKCQVTEEVLNNIIIDLCKLGEVNEELWVNNKIIFSQKFIDNIQDAYSKRNNRCINIVSLRVLLTSLGILKATDNSSKTTDNPDSIVYETIEEKTIENNTKPNNLIEVFFKDLDNCSELEKIAMAQKITVDFIKNKIPAFRKKAQLNYKEGWPGFINHFKNFINKELEIKNDKKGGGIDFKPGGPGKL